MGFLRKSSMFRRRIPLRHLSLQKGFFLLLTFPSNTLIMKMNEGNCNRLNQNTQFHNLNFYLPV